MGLPSKRRTKTSKLERASHFALKKKTLADCPKCKKAILPHHACSFCGTYRGKEIIKMVTKKKKTTK